MLAAARRPSTPCFVSPSHKATENTVKLHRASRAFTIELDEVAKQAQEEDLKQAMLTTQTILAQATYKINPI